MNRIVPLTSVEWGRLSGKAQWDVISALRGPDLSPFCTASFITPKPNSADTLKFLSTSVIRFRMSEVMRVGGLINTEASYILLPVKWGIPPGNGFNHSHFSSHIIEAAGWLNIPHYYFGKFVDQWSNLSPSELMKAFEAEQLSEKGEM